MSWRRLLVIGGVVLLAGTWGVADELSDKDWNEVVPMGLDQEDSRQIESTLVRMSHLVDLWHDATLKGQRKLVTQREQELAEVIKSDLASSYQYLDQCDRESIGWRSEQPRQSLGVEGTRPAQVETDQSRPNVRQVFSIVKAKQRLAGALSRATAFSNKLRLFGDYQDLLRREQNLGQVHLAEETGESLEDPSGE